MPIGTRRTGLSLGGSISGVAGVVDRLVVEEYVGEVAGHGGDDLATLECGEEVVGEGVDAVHRAEEVAGD